MYPYMYPVKFPHTVQCMRHIRTYKMVQYFSFLLEVFPRQLEKVLCKAFQIISHYPLQLFWQTNCSAWWRECVRTQRLKVRYYTLPPLVAREQSNSIKWNYMWTMSSVTTIIDSMQKHDVQIITVLGNCTLEYSTKGGHFCWICH